MSDRGGCTAENPQGGIPDRGGDAMGVLMIKCPTTGRDIPTGIEMDQRSFTRTPVFFSRTYCPFCRTDHEWFVKQAWVCEASTAAERKAGRPEEPVRRSLYRPTGRYPIPRHPAARPNKSLS